MATRCVLWDFGDTLVDQDWMLAPPEGVPGWAEAWAEVARGSLEDPWNLGEVSCEEVARPVAGLVGMSVPDAMAHIQHCCSSIRFFDATMEAARRCPLPQAIVTVNPDVFTRYVVSHYKLHDLFPVIVASWQEHTLEKAALCARALRLFEDTFAPSETLLIDNIGANVRDWEKCGGRGYVFVGESQFNADLQTALRELT